MNSEHLDVEESSSGFGVFLSVHDIQRTHLKKHPASFARLLSRSGCVVSLSLSPLSSDLPPLQLNH